MSNQYMSYRGVQDCQNEEPQMFRRFARKTFGSSQILADLGELTQAGRMQGGGALSPLPYYIADVEAICLLGKGAGGSVERPLRGRSETL